MYAKTQVCWRSITGFAAQASVSAIFLYVSCLHASPHIITLSRTSSSPPTAGHGPHNDMICSLPCVSGANDTANLTRSGTAPNISAGIFAPPYAINSGNEQLPLNTRTMPVTASHYDGAHPYIWLVRAAFEGLWFDLF